MIVSHHIRKVKRQTGVRKQKAVEGLFISTGRQQAKVRNPRISPIKSAEGRSAAHTIDKVPKLAAGQVGTSLGQVLEARVSC